MHSGGEEPDINQRRLMYCILTATKEHEDEFMINQALSELKLLFSNSI